MAYRDPSLPIPERVNDLLGRMTLDEKLAQMIGYWIFEFQDGEGQLSTDKLIRLGANGLGQVTRLAGASTLDPLESARASNAIQKFLMTQTRLGIPAIVHEECCVGYMALGATVFPQALGLAGTFRPELARRMTEVIRTQMRAAGAHQGLAPVLDLGRDPRWGRIEETFGEDPTLVSQFGAEYIRGLQGEKLADGGVMATAKHFIGHSLSQAGQNCAPVHLGRRELWELYLPPFQAAIWDAGVHSIMNSYPEIDGEVVAASRGLLTDLLRGQLGFEGLLVADYEAVKMLHSYHHLAPDLTAAAVLALKAGIEVELPSPACYQEALRGALEKGLVELELVDAAVRHHLEKKFELGLFEHPYVDEGRVPEVFDTPDQRLLTREIAGASLTLLTNNGVLPLKKDLGKLAVIGPCADDVRILQGDYSFAAMMEYMNSIAAPGTPLNKLDWQKLQAKSVRIPTVLDSIRAASPATQVLFEPGCEVLGTDRSGFEAARRAAEQAEAVILVLGDRSGLTPGCSCGETRDSVDLRLPGVQHELAMEILETGKPVVVVLVNGRPLAVPELAERADAILEAWLPGEEGGPAIAAALFGEINPGGKLPVTFPRHVGQIPIFYNQKPSGGKSNWYLDYVNTPAAPLFAFGHGLSYTTFEYTDLSLSMPEARAGETVDVRMTVKNTGKVAGEEVVQLYTCDEYACVPRPVKELKGFTRLKLEPGERQVVVFHLPVDQLAFYDEEMQLVVESGSIRVMIGSSSADIRLEDTLTIAGAAKTPVARRIFACPVEIRLEEKETG